MMVLMTKEKNPRVIMVIGKPIILKMGYTKKLSTDSTMAKIMAVLKSLK
jgi:hypothetical protein